MKNKIHSLSTLLIFSLLFGCATKQPKTTSETSGPPAPGEVTKQEEPQDDRPSPKVVLVLGGVGIASFATIGILKAFKEEGIQIDSMVATGWPAVFALGYGYLKSIHDLEWFSLRLENKDFYSESFLGKKGFSPHDAISKKLKQAFTQTSLSQASTPIAITASNLEEKKPDVYTSGGWVSPLMKAISAPGIYQPFPNKSSRQWILSMDGIDTAVAQERGANLIVAVDMYDDYLNSLDKPRDSSEAVFRSLFLTQFRQRLETQMAIAQLPTKISLRKGPLDFSGKRQAVQAGYEIGKRLADEIRSKYSE